MSLLSSNMLPAFLVTICVLVFVHEYGHYRTALAFGVKVLRFSIGFGPVIWRRQRGETEFALSLLPLGGYVMMLGEDGAVDVPASERHRTYESKPVWQRCAIVLAGPVANLLLAVLLYACVNWNGVQEIQPILGAPTPGSMAERAGLQAGERVRAVSRDEEDWTEIRSMSDLRWQLMQAALDAQPLHLELQESDTAQRHRLLLDFDKERVEVDARLLDKVGLPDVYMEPVLGEPMPGGPAQQAGLRSGDRLLSVDGTPVADKMHAIQLIRASAASGVQGAPRPLQIRAERNGSVVELTVQPRLSRGDKPVPMIEAAFSGRPQMVTIRYGFIEGLAAAARQTWEMSAVTLTMLGRIVTLQASPDNISGPLTIAAYAGRSAELGLSQFLSFLAVVSVSLGVLNLLPLPILDGGRLMYHLFEGVTGRPIPVEWRDRLLRGGLAIMLLVMSLALYNDVVRFLGPQT